MSGPSAARARVAAARTASRPDLAELALLLVPGAALLAEQPWLALVALTAWLIWRWRWSPPARERWLLGICGALAAAVLGTAAGGDLVRSRAAAPSDASLAAEYRAYWDELQASSDAAITAVAALGRPPLDAAAQLEAFARLGRLARESRLPGLTLVLLDADRQPVAWGGAGLLHDLGPSGAEGVAGLPASEPGAERLFLQSAAAATALVLRPSPGATAAVFSCSAARAVRGAPPRRCSASGASRASASVAEGRGPVWLWGFGSADSSASLPPAVGRAVRSPGLPPLLLATVWEAAGPARDDSRDRAALAIGLGLFGLAALRGFALAVLAGTVLKRPLRIFEVAALALSGVAMLGLGLATPAAELLLLLSGLALAGLGWYLVWSRSAERSGAPRTSLTTLGALVGR